MVRHDDSKEQIRRARHVGSRKTHMIPFADIERVLSALEKEAPMTKTERRKYVTQLSPSGKDRGYQGYNDRCATKMSVGSWRLLLVIALPLYTGFRRSDCIKIKWSDLMYFGHDQSINVRPEVSLMEQKTERRRKVPRKRSVPLGPEAAFYIMKAYMELKPRTLDEYCFVSRSASRCPHIGPGGYNKLIGLAFARFGVYDQDGLVSPHGLRKSYCWFLFQKFGSNFEAVMRINKILGHSTIEMTMMYLEVDMAPSIDAHHAISFRTSSAATPDSRFVIR